MRAAKPQSKAKHLRRRERFEVDEAAFVEPWDPTCEARFAYGSAGVIQVSNASDVAATTMIGLLKLDEPSLQLDRAKILAALEADIESGALPVESIPNEIVRLRTSKGGKRSSFSNMAAQYLETEFGG
jgi:hypothetical protein